MSSTATLMSVLLLAGLATLAIGVALMRSQRRAARAPAEELPREVAPPDEQGRDRILERAVFLSLELARVDGAIGEVEMKSIETFLADNVDGLEDGEPEEIVRRVLRATIHHREAPEAVREIARLGDPTHRELVVRMLVEVGRSDGDLVESEIAFLNQVCKSLGVDSSGHAPS